MESRKSPKRGSGIAGARTAGWAVGFTTSRECPAHTRTGRVPSSGMSFWKARPVCPDGVQAQKGRPFLEATAGRDGVMYVQLSVAALEIATAHARLADAHATRDRSLRHACSRCRHNAAAGQYKEIAGALARRVRTRTLAAFCRGTRSDIMRDSGLHSVTTALASSATFAGAYLETSRRESGAKDKPPT